MASMIGSTEPAESSETFSRKSWIQPLVRFLIWSLVGLCVPLSLTFNRILAEAPRNRIYDDAFASKWVSFQHLNPEIQSLARHAHLGDRPGYLEVLLARSFLSEDTRIELSLQAHQRQGLNVNTRTSEFVCIVWGSQYEQVLKDFLQAGKVSEDRYSTLVGEAKELSAGKTYWNSPASPE